MGNSLYLSDDDALDLTRKAIIPFRVRNNGFQVDYHILKFRSFTKAKVDAATDTKYDDSFLELNTRSKIVGDIRKVLTISAESISSEYASLRKNYYSRICFATLTFFIGIVLTNIGLVQNELPKGRIMMIFGGLLLSLTVVTLVMIVYTDRRLRILNREFVSSCVSILEKEKIVTWTASFQHLLFDIIYPYNGKTGAGAVILTPNPYFEMINQTTDEKVDIVLDPNANDKSVMRHPIPCPQWAIDESVSNDNENRPLIGFAEAAKAEQRSNQAKVRVRAEHPLLYDDEHENDDDGAERLAVEIEPMEAQQISSQDSDSDDDADDEREVRRDEMSPNEEQKDESPKNLKGAKGENKGSKVKGKKKQAPKAYTGFDASKENAKKVHGDLVQRYFHDAPEDIEGHGEDTGMLPLSEAEKKLIAQK